jgi:hypothetical protein
MRNTKKVNLLQQRFETLPVVPATPEEVRERQEVVAALQGFQETSQRVQGLLGLKAAAIPDAVDLELRTNQTLSPHEKAEIRNMMAGAIHGATEYLRTKTIANLETWITDEPRP